LTLTSACYRVVKRRRHLAGIKCVVATILAAIFVGVMVVLATAGFLGDEACPMDPCERTGDGAGSGASGRSPDL
jgi:hypothetical protein